MNADQVHSRLEWSRIVRRLVVLCAGVAVLAAGGARPSAAETLNLLRQWGSYGTGPGQFVHPTGMAVDPAGFVYVVDQGNTRLEKFDFAGNFITMWNLHIEAGSPFPFYYYPTEVAVARNGDVLVSNSYDGAIERFTSSGAHVSGAWAPFGAPARARYSNTSGIAVDDSDHVYVVDAGNRRVDVLDASLHYLRSWAEEDSTQYDPEDPVGLTIGTDEIVYVADAGGQRVRAYTRDGVLRASWGSQGPPSQEFFYPVAVAQSDRYGVVVADFGWPQLRAYSASGQYLFAFPDISPAKPGSEDSAAIAIVGDLVFELRWDYTEVRVFGPAATPAQNATWGEIKARWRL